MGGVDIRVGGRWLSAVAPIGSVSWSRRWPGGSHEASWHLSTQGRPTWTLPTFIRRGQLVEVFAGPRVWRGVLAQPVPGEGGWDMTATGLYSEASRFHALTSGGTMTSVPNTAIDAAIARGLPWKRTQSFSTTAVGAVESDLPTLFDLLNAWADAAGEFWGVDADGYVFHAPLPTSPTWVMTPGPDLPGATDSEYASHVYGRYLRSTDGTYQTVIASDADAATRWGRAEVTLDLTNRGAMTTASAQAAVDGVLAKGKARLGWTDDLEPGPWDLLTFGGGVPADFRHVREGQMVRVLGVMDPTTTVAKPIDVVIGEAKYDASNDSLVLSPMDKETSTLAEAIEKATGGSR